MKQIFNILTFVIAFCAVQISTAANAMVVVPTETTTPTSITLNQLSMKDYEAITGKKLSFRNKIVFYLTKKELMKKNKTVDKATFDKAFRDESMGFNLGGFLLGFFLSLLGVLIALLFGRKVLRSAWRGFLVGLVLDLILYFVLKDK
jgi:hypothetical protein